VTIKGGLEIPQAPGCDPNPCVHGRCLHGVHAMPMPVPMPCSCQPGFIGTYCDEVVQGDNYPVASESRESCTQNGLGEITSEAECEQACLDIISKHWGEGEGENKYSVNAWTESPGCFIVIDHPPYVGNCHWNTNMEARWTSPGSHAVCKHLPPPTEPTTNPITTSSSTISTKPTTVINATNNK